MSTKVTYTETCDICKKTATYTQGQPLSVRAKILRGWFEFSHRPSGCAGSKKMFACTKVCLGKALAEAPIKEIGFFDAKYLGDK